MPFPKPTKPQKARKPLRTARKPLKRAKSLLRARRPPGWKRREAKAANEVQPEELETIFLAFGGKCAYCKVVTAMEWDHFQPIAKGGQHVRENLFPSCRACNFRKGTLTWPRPSGHPFV